MSLKKLFLKERTSLKEEIILIGVYNSKILAIYDKNKAEHSDSITIRENMLDQRYEIYFKDCKKTN